MIRVLRDWLSTQPEDDDWDGELRWFNRSREWCGERYRIIVGDVMSEMEHEGGDVAPIHFGAEIELHLDNIGQWYDECERGRRGDRWTTHLISVCLWRWGLYISIRGQETPE